MTFKSNYYHTGIFTPEHPEKYKGDASNIVYRSSWELKVMHEFDKNPGILWWSSEELFIKYVNPIDNRTHKYFPDFIIRVKSKSRGEVTYMIEVKPHCQTLQPEKKKYMRSKRYINEMITYTVNQAKWRAADLYCKEQGWEFKILTEKHLLDG